MNVQPKSEDSTVLSPRDAIRTRLCELFTYRWHSITGVNAIKLQWQTITKHPLRPRVLWKQWQDPEQLVGVRFGSSTWYVLIDIDIQSLYHPRQNPNALRLIRAALETIGICHPVLISSSHSGGLHLYIPLPVMLSTFGVASAVKQCLEAQDIQIAPGILEVFPNCKSYAKPGEYIEHNAHRLPLQPASGSYLLDEDCHPMSAGLERFFQSWDIAAAGQSIEELQGAIAPARINRRSRRKHSVVVVEDWLNDLRTEIS